MTSKITTRSMMLLRWVIGTATFQALLLLIIALLIFFSSTILKNGYYSAADLTQAWPLNNTVGANYRPGNGLAGDTVFAISPALYFSSEEIKAGRFPFWNPYNGYGTPHLASYQSAVLSPFSIPFYIFDFRVALLVSPFLKLLSLGFFTYLFLRRIAITHYAALAGALAFMFGGYQIVWLSWSHIGAAVALPGGLYFIEGIIQNARRERPFLRAASYLGFIGVTATGLLAGHPETFFFCILIVAPYLLFRIVQSWQSWRLLGRYIIGFSGSSLIILLIALPQLLSFLEYLPQSTLYSLRGQYGTHGQFGVLFGILALFPDLLGNPSLRFEDAAIYSGGNYNELTDNYIGMVTVFFAGIGLLSWFWHRSARALFFAGVLITWIVYAYNVFGLGFKIQDLPIISQGVVSRSLEIFLFSLSCLAAMGLHACYELVSSKYRTVFAALVGIWGLALSCCSSLAIVIFLGWATRQPNSKVGAPGTGGPILSHILFIGGTFLIAACLLLVWVNLPASLSTKRVFDGFAAIIAGLIFLQSGYMHKNLNPAIDQSLFFPLTPTQSSVRQITGDQLTLHADNSGIPANSNIFYNDLSSIANYDGMSLKRAGDLLLTLLRVQSPHQVDWTSEQGANPRSLQALQVMGIHYVVTPLTYPFDHRIVPFVTPRPETLQAWPLLSGQMITQRFTATDSDLALVKVSISGVARSSTCTVNAVLEDESTAQEVTRTSLSCMSVQADGTLHVPITTQPRSQGRTYRLTLTSPATTAADALTLTYIAPAGGSVTSPSEHLVLDIYGSEVPSLEQVWSNDRVRLFSIPHSLPRYYTVGKAIVAQPGTDVIAMLDSPAFDYQNSVYLSDIPSGVAVSAANASSDGGPVQVLESTPTRIHLQTDRAASGWLVALQSYYPGWKATVNGQQQLVLRANGAFSAVPIESGANDIVLSYDPVSLKISLYISVITVLCWLLGVIYCLWKTEKTPFDE